MRADTERLVGRLANGLTIAFVATVMATGGVVLWPRVTSALGIKPAPTPAAYVAGDRIDTPADWHTGADYTLVVFARQSCGACQTAAPYLKELITHLRGRSAVVFAGASSPIDTVVGTGPSEADENARFARGLGLADDAIKDAPRGLRVRATPTLVLVNRQGVILGAWEGVGPEPKHAALTKTIDAAMK